MTSGYSQAPFLPLTSFIAEETEPLEPEARTVTPLGSPFVSVYELDGESAVDEPAREAYSTIVNELYDEEFDDALFELFTEARALHQEHMASGSTGIMSERLLTQHFSHLVRESEAMIDSMARQLESRGSPDPVDREIESFVEAYAPSGPLEPAFENFLGKLIKKVAKGVRKVAGTAWQAAKKVGFGLILGKIKGLFRPLLNRVLQKAIGTLPESVRPAAQALAQKLGFAAPAADAAAGPAASGGEPAAAPPADAAPVQDAAGASVTELQQEFDRQIAQALLAEDELELSLETALDRVNASGQAAPVMAELDAARERFIRELEELKPGESAQPHIQNFLPALLPALRIGFRVVGRPKIVNFLSGFVAKLIAKLIGPDQAPALSRAIVDSGLKLLGLEVSEDDRSRLGAAAVAATVEETLTRVAALPDYVLDNQELLEGFALEAFEQAAAANLPAVFPETVYQTRPDLLEGGVNAAWVMLPLRGPKRYKRCSRSFRVRITPHMAEEIESFEGAPLSDFLQDQLGVPEGAEVEAEVHLFEALPGTTVADIARAERETPGLGASDEATLAQLHPLTPEVARTMLGKPGLGRQPTGASGRHNLAAGQRLYHLAIAGRRPLFVPGRLGRRVRRLVHVNVTFDCPGDRIGVCVFISEVKAQRLAVQLRQQSHPGSLSVGFHRLIGRRLRWYIERLRAGQTVKRLRIVHAGVAPGPPLDAALQRLPAVAPQMFLGKLAGWLTEGFSEFVKTQKARFLAASEDPADGVTLRFTVEHPPGLKELCDALVDKGPGGGRIAEAIAKGASPTVRVEAFAGHKCD